ncbi:hypothetical protein HMPREF0880_00388 [Yokenella regensburgei ATCC 43003]|nr:hypothetical protein HMPREF0880_00388 [Yokenella regensburgei ATCC 43003]
MSVCEATADHTPWNYIKKFPLIPVPGFAINMLIESAKTRK